MKTLFTTAIAATMLTAGAFTIDSGNAQSMPGEHASSTLAAHHIYHQRVETIDPVLRPDHAPVQPTTTVDLEGAMGFTGGTATDEELRSAHQREDNIDPVLRPGQTAVQPVGSISLEGAMGFLGGFGETADASRQYVDPAGTSPRHFTSPR